MEKSFRKAQFVAKLLDTQFNIAGIRFGLDPLIDLIPYVGDVIGVLLSLYILNIAREVGVSRFDLFRMVLNIFLDFLVGFIPFLGAFFDVVFKANIRNLAILEKYRGKMITKGKVVDGEIV